MKKFIKRNNKFLLLFLSYVTLDVLSRLPYVNLVFHNWVVAALMWAVVIILFKLTYKWTFFVILLCLVASALMLIIQRMSIAENIGNLIYVLFFIGTFQYGMSVFKKSLKHV